MRLATYNINGTKARLGYVLHWLEATKPDVVGFQELKTTGDKFPYDEFRKLGYEAVIHAQKGWNGVAILSRSALELRQSGLPGQEEQGARLITAQVGNLAFMTIYAPNGKSIEHEDFPRKLAWYDALIDHITTTYTPADALVVCGDFNVVPEPIDSWNEAVWSGRIFHTEAERNRLRKLRDWGLVDLYRRQHPDEPGFSWWDYRAGAFHKKQGLRIDLLLGTASVAERLSGAEVNRQWRKKVDGLISSDHAPVWVDLDGSGAEQGRSSSALARKPEISGAKRSVEGARSDE